MVALGALVMASDQRSSSLTLTLTLAMFTWTQLFRMNGNECLMQHRSIRGKTPLGAGCSLPGCSLPWVQGAGCRLLPPPGVNSRPHSCSQPEPLVTEPSPSYLGDGQLQVNQIFSLAHRGLEGSVQQQDAVEVLPTPDCVVIHKKHLVHGGDVLTPDATARFSCDTTRNETQAKYLLSSPLSPYEVVPYPMPS